jgi:hypothetical protein
MALKFRLIIVCASLICLQQVCDAQKEWHKNSFGFELGAPGSDTRYSVISLSAWHAFRDRLRWELSLGYGGRGRMVKRAKYDPMYNETLERYSGSVQLFYHIERRPESLFFVGAGPYMTRVRASIGDSFIQNTPEGALTAHSGASLKLSRTGLLNSVGIRLFIESFTFDARMHLPVFYEESHLKDVQNPLLVLDFEPAEVHDYQREVNRIGIDLSVDFRIGIALNKKKLWQVIDQEATD